MAGRALQRVIQVAIDTGYLPPDFRYSDQQAFAHLPAGEVVALVTGSHGEQRAMLARMASGEAADMKLRPGDTVIF